MDAADTSKCSLCKHATSFLFPYIKKYSSVTLDMSLVSSKPLEGWNIFLFLVKNYIYIRKKEKKKKLPMQSFCQNNYTVSTNDI